MSDSKIVIPERKMSPEQLQKVYAHVENAPVMRMNTEGPERTTKDPFGFEDDPTDPFEEAKRGCIDVVRFYMLVSAERRLGTEGMIFLAELVALNILNAQNIPIPPAQVEAARKKAYDYYQESLAKIPDPPATVPTTVRRQK
jgi:hypothetical protein